MIRNLFFLILLLAFSGIQAQQKHFIYIQSENNQPFYVNLNNTIYSSTTSGYLNISQLLQGKYYLVIGFPKNLYSEQKFVVDVSDFSPGEGFTLKQKPDKSWCLVNYITNQVLNNDENAGNKKPETSVATNEQSVQEKPAAETSAKTNLSPSSSSTNVSVAPIAAVAGVTAAVASSANNSKKDESKESTIIKRFEKGSAQGVDLIYIDKSQSKADTIALFIPALKTDTTQSQVVIPAQQTGCIPANNEDFFKLRMYMAAAATEDGMVAAADKAFKEKCYSVEQIKNLGILFLEEDNRFKFFKAAKGHVTDEANFGSLQNQFFQTSYIEAFKNLAKNN